jgi:hypothetical protein
VVAPTPGLSGAFSERSMTCWCNHRADARGEFDFPPCNLSGRPAGLARRRMTRTAGRFFARHIRNAREHALIIHLRLVEASPGGEVRGAQKKRGRAGGSCEATRSPFGGEPAHGRAERGPSPSGWFKFL